MRRASPAGAASSNDLPRGWRRANDWVYKHTLREIIV
jgi:hypothetical protein